MRSASFQAILQLHLERICRRQIVRCKALYFRIDGTCVARTHEQCLRAAAIAACKRNPRQKTAAITRCRKMLRIRLRRLQIAARQSCTRKHVVDIRRGSDARNRPVNRHTAANGKHSRQRTCIGRSGKNSVGANLDYGKTRGNCKNNGRQNGRNRSAAGGFDQNFTVKFRSARVCVRLKFGANVSWKRYCRAENVMALELGS